MPFVGAAFLALISFIVMQLWNNLMPAVLHTGTVTYWQAMGLFVLSKLLFGFGRGHGFGGHWKRGELKKRLMNMTPEEREAFRTKMQRRWRTDYFGPQNEAQQPQPEI